MSSEQTPWHLRVIVFVLTRLIYFTIGFLVLPLGSRASGWTRGDFFPFASGWTFLAACVMSGVISAAFGPTLYNTVTTRGRGKLSEIRRNGRYSDQEEDG